MVAGWLPLSGCSPPEEAAVDPPRLVERHDLLVAEIGEPRMSPDGTAIAWAPVGDPPTVAVRRLDAVAESPSAEDGADSAVRTFAVEGSGALRLHRWVAPGRLLYGRVDTAGRSRLWSLDAGSGRSLPLSPVERHAELRVAGADRPGEILIALGDAPGAPGDLYSVDLESGRRTLVERNDRFAALLVDRDREVRLAVERAASGELRLLQRGEEGTFVDLVHPPIVGGPDAWLGFDRTNEVVYLISGDGGRDRSIVALRLTSGRADVLFRDEVDDVDQVLVDPASHAPQAVAARASPQRWRVFDETVRSDLASLSQRTEGMFEIVDRDRDDRRWLVTVDPVAGARRHLLLDRESGSITELFEPASGLAGVALAPWRGRTVRVGEGAARLTLPPEADLDQDGTPDQPLPAVVLPAGSPMAADPIYARWLANRGYAVLAGASGEPSAASAWAVETGVADAGRVAVVVEVDGEGSSFAAIDDRFACGVAFSASPPPPGDGRWLWIEPGATGSSDAAADAIDVHLRLPAEATLAGVPARLAVAAAIEAFLGDCLGGRVEPVGDELSVAGVEIVAGAERLRPASPAG